MTGPMIVEGFFADQGAPQAYGVSAVITPKPAKLFYLTAFNKGASTVYIELYDHPSAAVGTPRTLPLAAGGFIGWSQVLLKNGGFVRAVDAASGGSVIGSNDVKFDFGYTDWIV